MTTKLTPTICALQIIRDNWISSPVQFARLMWPEHKFCQNHAPAYERRARMMGNAFLAKLRRRGLIFGYAHIILDDAGRAALRASEPESEAGE